MALHFPLYVNETMIGYFYARRIDGDTEGDTINTYLMKIWTHRPADMEDTADIEFNMKHRYGDGAWVLIRKALLKAETLAAYKKAWNPGAMTRDAFMLSQMIKEAEASTKLDGETHII